MFSIPVDDEIELQLLNPAFAPVYVDLVAENYDYLAKWLAFPPHCKEEKDFLAFIRKSLHDYADGKSLVCAIFYRDTLIGNCSFNTINTELKRAEIGYWIAEKYQGNGIVTRVCRKLIELAFYQYELEKVVISAAVDNVSSRAVCERLGMRLEGIESHSEKIGDQILSHAHYAIFKPGDSLAQPNNTPSE